MLMMLPHGACLRMTRLIDRPEESAVLAPMIEREILFRVLQGPQGNMLRQIAGTETFTDDVAAKNDEGAVWIHSGWSSALRDRSIASDTKRHERFCRRSPEDLCDIALQPVQMSRNRSCHGLLAVGRDDSIPESAIDGIVGERLDTI